MTTIVTKFGKFRYNRLPMGMCALGNIYQSKVDKLLCDIRGVKTYIDDIIVLSKDLFKNNINQLRIIFGRLRDTGLKDNSAKCSFGVKEIPYLCYVIKMEGIKPDLKKLQGIMDIGRTATTTDTRDIMGMVKYYRYLWTRRSHILAPLTEAASGPKGINILWMMF